MKKLFFVLFWILIPAAALAQEAPLPRTLLAIYDSHEEPIARETDLHSLLELPANHLGYFFRYQDIHESLPRLNDDVAGVVIWFNPGVVVRDPEAWLNWIKSEVFAKGKKLIVFGSLGIGEKFRNSATGMAQLNAVMHEIGVHDENHWIDITYGAKVATQDPQMMEFERALSGQMPPYFVTTLAGSGSKSYLTMVNPTEHKGKADLVVTGARGGYVAGNYAAYRLQKEHSKEVTLQQWLIDPFDFLQASLHAPRGPIADVTTQFGRRIAFTQMDGDGWNNYSELLEHRNQKTLAAQAAMERLIQPHPDIPFSVGLIGAELDTDCYGLRDSELLAKKIAQLPNVQIANHTYSHIQYWRYFGEGEASREKNLLKYYPPKPSEHLSFLARVKSFFKRDPWKAVDAPVMTAEMKREQAFLKERFNHLPRSYACEPFTLAREILGNKSYLETMLPRGKKVTLMDWSGDTAPYPEARRAVRDAGMVGLGGGVTRYIIDYPSLSTLSPYGYVEGSDVQIYASNGNENALRGMDEDYFTGLRYFPLFARQTETPRRLLPLNLYFHAADAGNPLALTAVEENIQFIRSRPFLRLESSQYAELAHQFYQVKIIQKGNDTWEINGISRPLTIRFAQSSRDTVDFEHSQGVWGMRYLQGNLYVQLAQKGPYLVALKRKNDLNLYPAAPVAYVIDSAWTIKDLRISKSTLILRAQGYGLGKMRWRMPQVGTYLVRTEGVGGAVAQQEVAVDGEGILNFTLAEANGLPVTLTIRPKE